MSKLETNTIDTISGTTNLVIGSTNSSTVTFESGAPTGQNYPAFHAYLSSDQTLNNNTTTVVAFDAETFDTDSCFNTSTYRFTPNKAGKYQFSFCANLKNTNGVYYMQADLRKNGSNVSSSRGPVFENSSSSDQSIEMVPLVQTIIMDMNGSSDYIDVTAYFYNNGNGVIDGQRSFINGFRLGSIMADGTLKVGTITNSAGSGNITIGSGVTLQNAVPAFEAYLSADQSISDETWTKANINTELFDTNNTYDNSTNYRFTVPSGAAGKYNIYAILNLTTDGGNELDLAQSAIYKNGSVYRTERMDPNSTHALAASVPVYAVMDLAVADYIEIYAYVNRSSGGTIYIKETNKGSFFGAYKVGA